MKTVKTSVLKSNSKKKYTITIKTKKKMDLKNGGNILRYASKVLWNY